MDVPHISAHGAPNLKEQFHQIFQKYQFPLSGVVDYDLSLPLYREHASRYEEWIQNQSQGEMNYLARGLERRMNPMLVFPELKSVIVVARPYSPHPVGTSQIRYARYLNGPDYHESMKVDLECSMLEVLRQEWVPKNLKYKICVDTSAVLERTWAALAGLGWIGKNTLLIHPQFGSYLFLGVIFTNQSFGKPPTLHLDYCGNCTRCLDTCPTGAFPESHYLESKKCISYLTLEKRGPWSEPFDSKGFVAGCDICQEVCPYNLKITKSTPKHAAADYLISDLRYLNQESKEQYEKRVTGTALARIKYDDFKRNLKAMLESSLDE